MGEITLECRGLVKYFGGIKAVDNVSAMFEAGSITALVGNNGAGKTTLFHLLAGALKPSSGDVLCGGRSIGGIPPWMVARLGIGRLFQDTRIFNCLSVRENVLVAFQKQTGERPFAALFRRRRMRCEEIAHEEEAIHWLNLIGLADYSNSQAEALSYGQQKLLAIARLLAGEAKILLLDEPTAGIHPDMIGEFLTFIRHLAQAKRCTVVLIEHNMKVVREIADLVYFMDDGKIVASGAPEELFNNSGVLGSFLDLSCYKDESQRGQHSPQ